MEEQQLGVNEHKKGTLIIPAKNKFRWVKSARALRAKGASGNFPRSLPVDQPRTMKILVSKTPQAVRMDVDKEGRIIGLT